MSGQRPIVIKVGGRALEGAVGAGELARAVRTLGSRVVIVHGGGSEVSAWSERLGLVPQFEGGRRVTDSDTLDVAVAVLAGLANKRLVAGLQAHGVDAVGLAALDGRIAEVTPHANQDLGAVGAVKAVDPALLLDLLARRHTPVLASIGAAAGRLLNVNADDLAAAVAPAVGAATLLLLSDAPGVVLEGGVVPHLDAASLASALQSEEVTGGMTPKLECAQSALERGVDRVWIGTWSAPGALAGGLTALAGGTWISFAEEQGTRGETPAEEVFPG